MQTGFSGLLQAGSAEQVRNPFSPFSNTHFISHSSSRTFSARRRLVRSIFMAPEPDDSFTEDERRALRGSKFAPLPPPAPPSFSHSNPRLAHPGGPVKTNKAAALAKFLERKLQQPDGLKSINPDLVELAVKNAKETVKASSVPSTSGRNVRHVASFEDSSESSGDDEDEATIIDIKKRKREKTKDSSDIEEPGKETKKRQKKKKKKDKKKKEGKMRKKSNS